MFFHLIRLPPLSLPLNGTGSGITSTAIPPVSPPPSLASLLPKRPDPASPKGRATDEASQKPWAEFDRSPLHDYIQCD